MTDTYMPPVEGFNFPDRDIRELRPEVAEQIAQMAAGPKMEEELRFRLTYPGPPNRDHWEPAPETVSARIVQSLDNPNIKWK
jgi:hypothetical protein